MIEPFWDKKIFIVYCRWNFFLKKKGFKEKIDLFGALPFKWHVLFALRMVFHNKLHMFKSADFGLISK